MKFNTKAYMTRKTTWYSFLSLLLAVIWGFFGGNGTPWHNWEGAAILFTFIITVVLFIDGFFGEQVYDLDSSDIKDTIKKIGIMALCVFAIAILTYILINNMFFKDISSSRMSRSKIMFILFSIACIFGLYDSLLGRYAKEKYIRGFQRAFYYFDIPTILAFGILFIYSFKVGDSMEPFFSGAIAFQMILTIFLWSFNNPNVFEEI